MSSQPNTLSPGRRAVPWAGCVPTIVCFVFLFILAPTSAAAADKTTWEKYNNAVPGDTNTTSTDGRIPLGTDGQGDDQYARYAAVIKDGSTNRMWYSGKGAGGWCIYYATSTDGLIWTKYNNDIPGDTNTTSTHGRIPQGTAGTGDENGAFTPSVIKDSSTYKMWYTGLDSNVTWRIYHATSPDGLTWTKYSNSIPADSNSTGTYGRIPLGTSGGDSARAYTPSVIKDGSTYKMWYTGSDGTNARIYHVTSSNGLTWTKYDNSVPAASDTTSTNGRIPLGSTSGTGDEKQVNQPTVVKVGSTYKMWYTGLGGAVERYRIYYATSTDGLTWKKYDNSVPTNSNTTSTNGRIPIGITGGDISHVDSPCVIKDGYFYKMWYGGYADTWRMYHATLDALPEGTIFYSY